MIFIWPSYGRPLISVANKQIEKLKKNFLSLSVKLIDEKVKPLESANSIP